jgi:hypothetical protein
MIQLDLGIAIEAVEEDAEHGTERLCGTLDLSVRWA